MGTGFRALLALLLLGSPALAIDDASLPARFPIPWGNSAGGAYIRTIPTASQIGIQNCAASLTDGFPPLTFVPSGSGGCPPFGQDMNGILNEITKWSRWQQMGGAVPWDSSFSSSIGGYPKGAIVQSATAGQAWLNTVDNNSTNPDAAGAGWQAFYVANTGVTAGTYLRPKVTVSADGKLTSAASGAAPTYQSFCAAGCASTSTGGTVAPTSGVVRWKVRIVGGGGGGGGNAGNGGGAAATTLNFSSQTWQALGGAGGHGGAGFNDGAPGLGGGNPTPGTSGVGTQVLRMQGTTGMTGLVVGGSGVSLTAQVPGGASFLGGNGGTAATPGTGAGGPGAATATPSQHTAGGGGSGEYVEFVVLNPISSTFAVGAGGTAGATGGTAGASGGIWIEEFYD